MLNYHLKIALAPIRRDVADRPKGTPFNWFSAKERAEQFISYIKRNFTNEQVEFIDTDGALIFNDETAAAAAARFKAANVDGILLINCNFGNEEAAAELAKAVGKPLLLWAPLDEEYTPAGIRTTDSQCGLFGIARQLQRYHVPFSHLPSCRVESAKFKAGFERFIRVACMVKNFTDLRIGQVGPRPAPFYSVIWNEGELMEKFGLRITALNFGIIEDRMKRAEAECPEEIAKIEQYILTHYRPDEDTLPQIRPMATMVVMYQRLFEEYKLDVLVAECWTATPLIFNGLAPCTPYGILNDMGYMIACESDIHCAMTMVLLKSATLGKGKPLFGEFTVRHPERENVELLWHCGQFPLSQKATDCEARLVNQRSWFRAKNGTYTVARLDQESGNYKLLPLLCNATDGPATSGTYLWAEFEELDKIESKILEGPYIHHFIEIEGDYTAELQEFCKYFPQINIDHI
ncbi:MAG: hypothetical protein IJN82_07760 [Clostridia bacterium]|nr:hypothetical protein [Clostridia bacterium]